MGKLPKNAQVALTNLEIKIATYREMGLSAEAIQEHIQNFISALFKTDSDAANALTDMFIERSRMTATRQAAVRAYQDDTTQFLGLNQETQNLVLQMRHADREELGRHKLVAETLADFASQNEALFDVVFKDDEMLKALFFATQAQIQIQAPTAMKFNCEQSQQQDDDEDYN